MATEPTAAVGVDVMDLDRRPLKEMTSSRYIHGFRQQLTNAELMSLMAIEDEDERYQAFYRIWVMKEAFVKALGTGLGLCLRRVECVPTEDGCWGIVMDGIPRPEWSVRFLNLSPAYLWCVVTGPSRSEVRLGIIR